MSRGCHGQVHCAVQIMGELAKEHEGGLPKLAAGTHFASGRCAIEPTQEDAWRDDNLVREFYSEELKPACAYFGPVQRKTY